MWWGNAYEWWSFVFPKFRNDCIGWCVDVFYATSEVHCCELANGACACVCCAVEYSLHIQRSDVNSLCSFMCWPHFMTCQMRRIQTVFTLITFVVYVKGSLFIAYCTPHDERFKPDTISIRSTLRKCSIFASFLIIYINFFESFLFF